MKWTTLIFVFVIFGCQPNKTKEKTIEEENGYFEESDSMAFPDNLMLEEKMDWDYQSLYGDYVHESTSQGFTAFLELKPEGNDLSFSLSVQQNTCNGNVTGLIGMAIFSEQEYAGFFDNPDCRLEFIFNLKANTIRIQEIGFCRLRTSGCSFEGVYRKK